MVVYIRPSIGWSVGRSVGRVGLLAGRLVVGWSVCHNFLKQGSYKLQLHAPIGVIVLSEYFRIQEVESSNALITSISALIIE